MQKSLQADGIEGFVHGWNMHWRAWHRNRYKMLITLTDFYRRFDFFTCRLLNIGKILLLEEMFGPVSVDMMWAIKNAFDPKGIMNPGKVLKPRY